MIFNKCVINKQKANLIYKGIFDLDEIRLANRYLGPFFFVSAQILLLFIMMNM